MRLSDQAGTFPSYPQELQTPPTSHLAPCQRPSGRSIRPKRSSLSCATERPSRSIGYRIPTSHRSRYGPRTNDSGDWLPSTHRKSVHPKLPPPENPHQKGSTQTLAIYPGEAPIVRGRCLTYRLGQPRSGHQHPSTQKQYLHSKIFEQKASSWKTSPSIQPGRISQYMPFL